MRLSCSMDLSKLPYDSQTCPVRAETFRDTSALDIGFRSAGPIEKLISGGSLEWEVGAVSGKRLDEAEMGTAWGASGVMWQFKLHRRPEYYEKYIITPCIMTVAIAWCSFFISPEAAPARVAMSIICFLAVSGMVSSVMSSLPPFGGEIWLLTLLSGSQSFNFAAVFQFGACSLLDRLKSQAEAVRVKHKSVEDQREDETIIVEGGAEESWNPDVDTVSVPASADNNQQHPKKGSSLMSSISELEVKTVENIIRAKDKIVAELGIWSRCFLTSNGELRITSQDLDIFFRVLYPIAYAIFLGVLCSDLQSSDLQ